MAFFFPQNAFTALLEGTQATRELGEVLSPSSPGFSATSEPRFSQVFHEDTVPAKPKRGDSGESLCEGQEIGFTEDDY